MIGVIIAAGFGSRLWNITNQTPKTLLPFGEGTILSTIISQLKAAGVSELIIVVGYNQSFLREYLEGYISPLPITIVENTEWERGNGLSVYKVRELVGNKPFILSMSDHIVHLEALRLIVNSPLTCSLLLVDRFINTNFDLDDATKVKTLSDNILAIGKELTDYNALDCGVFRLESDFFGAMELALQKEQESISAAITELIGKNRMKAVFVNQANQWLDIDTPEAYEFARQSFALS